MERDGAQWEEDLISGDEKTAALIKREINMLALGTFSRKHPGENASLSPF